MYKNGKVQIGLRRVCSSEARVLAALTVRKRSGRRASELLSKMQEI